MKILWLTNLLLPDHAVSLGRKASPRGGWMPSLLETLVDNKEVELAVATDTQWAEFDKQTINGVTYYTIPMPTKFINGRHLPTQLGKDYQSVVKEFQPDIIHIHGTEYFHGHLTGRAHIKCPTVISIQGILDAYQKYYLAEIPFTKLLSSRTLRDWVRFDGLIEQKIKFSKRARLEREIFSSNQAFIGRTTWDRAHLRRLNPAADYYHCDEMIRAPFFNSEWKIDSAVKHSIFCSSASYPLKGFHVLVKAVALLKNDFPNITVRTPLAGFYPMASGCHRLWKNLRSGGYARYLTDLIRAEGLEQQIIPLPLLDADLMVKELLKAHAFVLPSFIENSPNSLAEAMLLGTPSVAAYVGGVPDMTTDRQTALHFQSGDEVMLAERLREMFTHEDMAIRISKSARSTAHERHSPERIVKTMIDIYQSATHGKSNS